MVDSARNDAATSPMGDVYDRREVRDMEWKGSTDTRVRLTGTER